MARSTKKIRAYAFTEDFNDALTELASRDGWLAGPNKKTQWLEQIVAGALYDFLVKGKVDLRQRENALHSGAEQIFALFVKFARAMRGVDGYGIMPDGYVFGPDEYAAYEAIKKHPPTGKPSKLKTK